jgi:hypothetical protein
VTARAVALALLLTLPAGAAAHAQLRTGPAATGVHFQGYSFDRALGIEAANLILLPAAWSVAAGRRAHFDIYTAWGRGAALIGGTEFTLSGPTDTRVRANISATPWAVVTIGLNLPTGRTGHTSDEARVAAVLGSDLFAFREANFGLGFGATAGVATAHRIGATGLGAGVSYRLAGGFEPRADTAFTYTPGNELRVRIGIDRNIGRNKLTAGVTYQNFSSDQVDGIELFQPGGRWRGDVTYSFRTGAAASWTAFLTDVWRDHGDVRFGVLDPATGAPTGERLRTGTQNLVVAGITGSWRLAPSLLITPVIEARSLSRQDPGGDGWLIGIGSGIPFTARGIDIAPAVRLNFGSVHGDDATGRRILGGELAISATFGGR